MMYLNCPRTGSIPIISFHFRDPTPTPTPTLLSLPNFVVVVAMFGTNQRRAPIVSIGLVII